MKRCRTCGYMNAEDPCRWCASKSKQAQGFCSKPKDGKFCYLKKDHKGKCHVRRDD